MTAFEFQKLRPDRNGILLFITAVALCASAYGQFGEGSIHGRILDREGKPLQGAVVQIEHITSHRIDDAKTNKNGIYSISGLYAGQYKVTVVVTGKAVMAKGTTAGDAIYVASGLDVSVNFDLRSAPATPPAGAAPATAAAVGSKDDGKTKAAEKKTDAEMRALFSAGLAALKANNFEEALQQFTAAAEKDPAQPGVFQNLGLAFAKVKKYEESAAAYRKAIELKPDDAGLHAELASALADAGKFDESMTPLQEAARLNPSVGAQGYYNLGVVLMNRGKSKEAVEAFSSAVRFDANYAKPYFQLGVAYFGSVTTMPQAVSSLEKFLQLNPAGPDAETAKQLIEAARAQLKK